MRFSFTSISRSEACSGVGLNKFTDFVCTDVLVDKRHFRNPILDVSRLIPSIILFLFTSYKYYCIYIILKKITPQAHEQVRALGQSRIYYCGGVVVVIML